MQEQHPALSIAPGQLLLSRKSRKVTSISLSAAALLRTASSSGPSLRSKWRRCANEPRSRLATCKANKGFLTAAMRPQNIKS